MFDDEDAVEGVGPGEEDEDELYPDRSQWEVEEDEKVNKPRPAAAAITEKVTLVFFYAGCVSRKIYKKIKFENLRTHGCQQQF